MNTRLAVATHILTFLAFRTGSSSSETIASSVNTNASLVRRMLMHLNRAGLTVAEKGATGGTRLARDAHDITLLDVYTALDDATGTFRLHAHPNAFCPVGRTIKAALEPRLDAAEAKLRAELAKTTIADLSADVLAASGGHAQAC